MNELKELLRFRMQHESYFSINYKFNKYFEKLVFTNWYNRKVNITHYLEKDFYLLKIYDNDNNLISKNTYYDIDELKLILCDL